jgi:carboxyl-terminal processing protease
MEQVLDMLRGKVGESVDLIIRRGKNMEFPVTLVRAIIEVPVVKYGMIEGTKIGYVRLIEFTPHTVERTQEALDSFQKNGATGLIIDLRNNPGGLITSAADIADKFIDNGPIVSTKSRLSFENSVFTATTKKTTVRNMPIVVLINKGSASASEIVSGALKDNHLAYLVGQRTYGKGSVQQVLPLSSADGIKITMARYYTPSDVNIDKIGIPPDREVLFPVLSEEGEKQYLELYKSTEIADFVDGRSDLTEKQISDFAKKLKKKYSEIDESSLRKLVRNEVNKTKGTMLYDLDYDIQLNEAISILQKEDFTTLIKNTKTLKELQDLAILEDKERAEGAKLTR